MRNQLRFRVRALFKILVILFAASLVLGGVGYCYYIFTDESAPDLTISKVENVFVFAPLVIAFFSLPSIVFNATTFKKLETTVDLNENVLDEEITQGENLRKKPSGWKVITWGSNIVLSILAVILAGSLIGRIVLDWLENKQHDTPGLAYMAAVVSAVLGVLMLIDSIRWRRSYSRSKYN